MWERLYDNPIILNKSQTFNKNYNFWKNLKCYNMSDLFGVISTVKVNHLLNQSLWLYLLKKGTFPK